MKALLFLLLLFPLFSFAQTVHRKGNKIFYEGEVPLPGRPAGDVMNQLQATVASLVKKGKNAAAVQTAEQSLAATGDMQLHMAYGVVRTVNYTIHLTAKDGGYTYQIDSVFVTEKKRGGTAKTHTDKDLLRNMEISGPVAEAAERVLNEIDMNFQKLLAVMRLKMVKENPGSHR